jgi:hypothetical protein
MRRPLLSVLALSLFAACGGSSHHNPDAPSDGPNTTMCATLAPLASGTCSVTAGSTTTLLEGNILAPDAVYVGGQVAIDATGMITCVGCNCAAGGETTIVCPDSAISPGLINTHDHITFTQDSPYTDTGERYDDRQQWREGLDGHTKIPAAGGASADQQSWGELRFLMGGATATVGSGGAAGLLRNLDKSTMEEGLTQTAVKFDTFPLGDSSGTRELTNCNYGTQTLVSSLATVDSYEPHTSEGVDSYARNEFLCESSDTYDTMAPGISQTLTTTKTAMIHAIGLTPDDYALMASKGTSLIWSPRSNITLYGDTARVTVASRLGVRIALGTDWMATGSMNMLRELQCADSFNTTYLGKFFSDQQLWQMATSNAAGVTATDDVIGSLAMGKVADVSIFAAHGKDPYRAVIEAQPQDVALVMRGGKVLYGDDNAVGMLAQGCDQLDVCGTTKQVCLMSEIGKNLAALQTSVGSIYPAFQCGTPMNEPNCTPKRPVSVAGSTVYTGMAGAGDMDGDGIADAMDNCPSVFNPIRPVDNGKQGDLDGDGVGDECDVCPRDANTTTCTQFDPNDLDGDGVPNATDNCPNVANPTQTDTDMDGKGDACDACPTQANPGSAGCPATIYQIKQNQVAAHEVVEVTNALVTGTGTNGFFVQVKETDAGYMGSDYSGLFVFTGTGSALLASAVVGTRVTIDGSVDVFQGETELDAVTNVTQTTTMPETAPAAITATYAEIATGGTRAAKLEGVIVSLGASSITAATAPLFTVTDAMSNNLVVGNFLYTYPTPIVGQPFTSLQGVLALRGMVSNLLPRAATDVVAGPPVIASFGPMSSFTRVGAVAQPTFPTPLTVTLTGPAQGNTTVAVMTDNAGVLVPGGTVTIPNGQTSATVPVTSTAKVADVTFTAILGTSMGTAHVRSLDVTENPSMVTLSPATAAIAPGGTKTFAVTLDIPASTGGTVVNLSATAGTVPASVTVAANQISATFSYTAPMTGSTATLTATLGGSTSTATITIGLDHIVINEVDYDNVGSNDAAEYVEIFNPTGADVDLTGLALVLVNGANNATYDTVDLSTAGTLPAGGYLVVAGAGVTVPSTALKIDPGWTTNAIQNGSPDGMAIVDTNASKIVDALSYEGSITMAVIAGFSAPVSLVEGTALSTTVADSNTVDESLCREPNGNDTDNANSDWTLCTTKTPGTANP